MTYQHTSFDTKMKVDRLAQLMCARAGLMPFAWTTGRQAGTWLVGEEPQTNQLTHIPHPGSPALLVANGNETTQAELWRFWRRRAHEALIAEVALREFWLLDPHPEVA